MGDFVIETDKLSVYYGRQLGIRDIDLKIEKGEVFGFLGPNGAGKTTTQRVLLDVIRPTAGTARMFGLDCQKEGVEARANVGYLPGELSLYESMKVSQFFKMFDSMLGERAVPNYWKTLAERLQLDTNRKIGKLSRGNKQKVGVVTAFMSKAKLLVLDEPTSGLDPLVQQSVLDLVLETKDEGNTVFFSSHILSEVQVVCDRVGIVREGKLVAVERVEDLIRQQFKRLRISFRSTPPENAFDLPGVEEIDRDEHGVMLEIRENLEQLMETAVLYGIKDIETHSVSLEEIFLAYYGANHGGSHA
jgi:ABC-2 type transport system ATP-binding protein